MSLHAVYCIVYKTELFCWMEKKRVCFRNESIYKIRLVLKCEFNRSTRLLQGKKFFSFYAFFWKLVYSSLRGSYPSFDIFGQTLILRDRTRAQLQAKQLLPCKNLIATNSKPCMLVLKISQCSGRFSKETFFSFPFSSPHVSRQSAAVENRFLDRLKQQLRLWYIYNIQMVRIGWD